MDTPSLPPSNSSLVPTQNNNPATHWQCPVQEWASHPVLIPGEHGVSAGLHWEGRALSRSFLPSLLGASTGAWCLELRLRGDTLRRQSWHVQDQESGC